MQAIINKISTNEIDNSYYPQNYINQNTNSSSDKSADYEQMVFNSAGKDVLFNGPINNPLSVPENRIALQEIFSSEISAEFQDAGNGGENYQPVPVGTGSDESSDYQPVLVGTGSDENADYQPILVGAGSDESADYQPVLVGTGSDENKDYQPILVGTGSDENKDYQPVLVGTGADENADYKPILVGVGSGENNTDDSGAKFSESGAKGDISEISTSKASDKKNHIKDSNKATKNASDKHSEVKRTHKSVHTAKPHRRVSRRAFVRSPMKNMMRQMEQNIKESIRNSKNRSRELSNELYKNNNANSLPDDNYVPKHVDDDINCGCPTCQNRRFVDRSGDIGVSFKAPQKMNTSASILSIRAHEGEHVAAENMKAFQQKHAIVRQSVTISMRNCPTCGSRYASGGVTRTVTKLRADVAYRKAMESIKRA